MDFPSRMRIALGSAKGLAYLHEDCMYISLFILGKLDTIYIFVNHYEINSIFDKLNFWLTHQIMHTITVTIFNYLYYDIN